MKKKVWIIGIVALVILSTVAYAMRVWNRSAQLTQEAETVAANLVGILVENDPAKAKVGYSLAGEEGTTNLDLSLFKRELVDSYLGRRIVISGDQRRERLTRKGLQDKEPTDFVYVMEMKLAE